MVTRRLSRLNRLSRLGLLLAMLPTGVACVATGNITPRVVSWGPGGQGNKNPDNEIGLPVAEQMIDDLDRMMTANGTIGVKSPDVWGQDRLAKFRSEYESQMSDWLKVPFNGDINASIRRGEIESRRVQLGANLTAEGTSKGSATGKDAITADSLVKSNGLESTSVSGNAVDKAAALLEPTVVLDEHSNYLNHLNQLRRINAGDDLTDRPGYGLYLVRMPVTLSPGPRSRRGKGAIITVSARSLMTKDTLRSTLRNAVINETVNNLTQSICNQACKDGNPASAPGAGPFSLVAFADTEVFYGQENIRLLRSEAEHQLAQDLGDEPHHRSARIAEWLRGELEAAYHMLEEAARPVQSSQRIAMADPLEELGDLVIRRDHTRLAELQASSAPDGQVLRAGGSPLLSSPDDPGSNRRRVVNILGFALRIQAAAVNRRLKQDMVDTDPSLKKDELKLLSFFDPDASDAAMRRFERYVNAKWPLRVYAIEPVIAQQNVADAFGRHIQSAFDIAGSAPVVPLKLLSGLATAGLASERRTNEDETAIRLNPTMVGFGAGESTFGWIFYPRIQTRMRDGRWRTDIALLLNGRFPDPGGNEQSIEPGQRECTALIVMPNFVPKIEFITVANWFRTSEVGEGQKSDLEKSTTLSRRLVEAENALNRVKLMRQYRPEEYDIALERLNQIKSLMPTQRLIVRVPFTDNNNDSRIFCSQGGQLRPSLLAWHGRPPLEGDESTILLEGTNFSVHDTHVIAGGKPAKAVLVSRNVLQVTIAKDASPTPSMAGDPLLDINVATPNGVSNHLLIKMRPPDSRRKSAEDAKLERRPDDEKSEAPTDGQKQDKTPESAKPEKPAGGQKPDKPLSSPDGHAGTAHVRQTKAAETKAREK